MDKYVLQVIYNRLLEIKEGIKVISHGGICVNLVYNSDFNDVFENKYKHVLEKWLKEQFQAWPECHKYEGTLEKDIFYPINGKSGYRKEDNNVSYWKNPKRHRLLDFLIEQAEKQLE